MKTITCQVCGTSKRILSTNVGKYCSMACRSEAAQRVETDCLNCGTHVIRLRSQCGPKGVLKYCSRTCQLAHVRKPLSVCEYCGKEFRPTRRGAGEKAQRFCSMQCRGTAMPPNLIDGRSRHPEYSCWYNMVGRCMKPDHPYYYHYGGRGITVCEEWLVPENFYRYLDEHLGPRPPKHSIDRICVDGNYEPGNIRWATTQEQMRNRRPYMVDPRGPDKKPKLRLRHPEPNVWVIS